MRTAFNALGHVTAAALVGLCGCSDASSSMNSGGAGGTGAASSTSSGGAGGGTGGTASTSTESTGGTSSTSSGGAGGGTGGTTSSSSGGGGVGGGAPVVIVNPGFEANAVAAGSYNDQIVPTGWVKYDPGNIIGQDYNSLGVLNPTGTNLYPNGAPEGSNVALVFLWREQTDGIAAGISQQLSHALLAGTHYTLRVKVGNIAADAPVAYDLNGFPGYRVELLAGNTVLAADDSTLAPADGSFAQSTVSFTTGASGGQIGQPVGIRLINLNAASSGIEVNFDDVELDAAPAP